MRVQICLTSRVRYPLAKRRRGSRVCDFSLFDRNREGENGESGSNAVALWRGCEKVNFLRFRKEFLRERLYMDRKKLPARAALISWRV
jgi:hypothetical protein